ncbi:hypothetical protein ACWC10_21270 [Streptomyces sp. NPDC001595]|uniref:hypothetical protein n=1 Tax=Streptomyces sp. NPDC001532 TaxID=3154520 RepID=UPI003330E612
MRKDLRRVRVLTAACLAAALTACGSSDDQKLSYPVPDDICGIAADKGVLEALLDDGEEFEQDSGHFSLEEGQICHMYVDGNESVMSIADWNEKGYELPDLFQGDEPEGLRFIKGGTYASWDFGVATVIACPGVSEEGDVVSVEVTDMKWDEESRALLEKLVPSYFDAYKKELGCPG